MTQTSKAMQTGLTRILTRFGRTTTPRQTLQQPSRWYDCDVSARGL